MSLKVHANWAKQTHCPKMKIYICLKHIILTMLANCYCLDEFISQWVFYASCRIFLKFVAQLQYTVST